MRLRTYWIVALVCAVALGYGVYRLVEWPGFRLRSVEVHGLKETARADVLQRAAFGPHPNMWLVDLGSARVRIETLPYVRTATLIRVPPATIAISIVERKATGCLAGIGGTEGLIDRDGRVLTDICEGTLPTYRQAIVVPNPGAFVRDPALARLQADEATLRAAGDTFVALGHDRFGQLDATMPGGVIVRFGDETDLGSKARMVAPILQTAEQQLGPVESIDLRAPATPVVRFRGGKTTEPVPKQ